MNKVTVTSESKKAFVFLLFCSEHIDDACTLEQK